MNLKMIINSYGAQIALFGFSMFNMFMILKLKDKYKEYKDLVNRVQKEFEVKYDKKVEELFIRQNSLASVMTDQNEKIEQLKAAPTTPSFLTRKIKRTVARSRKVK